MATLAPKQPNLSKQGKHWSITIFDLTCDPKSWKKEVQYCVWQLEQCPKTGKMHYQTYVVFKKNKRMAGVQKLAKGHWEIVRNFDAMNDYCQKVESRVKGPWTYGERPAKQGSKFDAILRECLLQTPLRKIAARYPGLFMRYHGGITRTRELMTPKRNSHTQLVWIWGPSGSGKTTYAKKWAKMGDRSVYFKPSTTKWWPLYDQEDIVIIDDYKGAMLPSELFNLGGNSHPMQVEIKGMYTQFNSDEVVFTSVKHPSYIYGDSTNAWAEGLRRRLKGFTFWMSPNHRCYKTDWVPAYKGDDEEPPACQRVPASSFQDPPSFTVFPGPCRNSHDSDEDTEKFPSVSLSDINNLTELCKK